MIEQDPLWMAQSPAIIQAVPRGEAMMGIGPVTNAMEAMKDGQPVKVAKLDHFPGLQQIMLPIKGSPHPNAALLWSAFYATEGAKMASELGFPVERGWPHLDTASAKLIKELGVPIVMITEPATIIRADQLQEEVGKMIERAGVKVQ
jgi:hypothetical protein